MLKSMLSPFNEGMRMTLSFQSVDVTGTTNSRGQLTYTFDKPIDQVQATVNVPNAMVSCSAAITGEKEVVIRFWRMLKVFPSRQVTVSLLGIKHSTASAAEKSSQTDEPSSTDG